MRRYGLEQLLRVMGVQPIWSCDAQPAIYYGDDPSVGETAVVWIGSDRASGSTGEPLRLADVESVPVVFRGQHPNRLWDGRRLSFDVVAATTFWLTLESERYVDQRDAHGRIPGPASLVGAADQSRCPPVHAYADLLFERLRQDGVVYRPAARWPGGKRYAVAFTHDVDLPERTRRTPALAREFVLGGARSRRETYWAFRAEVRSRGFWEACFAPATRRKEWDFARHCDLEHRHGIRSAFYFAVVDRQQGHPRDVSYDVARRRYRTLCRRLAADGWEIGLQASYLAGTDSSSVSPQAARLAALTGSRASGVRHHYLRLDGDRPMRTLAAHADAGLAYDTSIGFNDRPGFRAGVALPFQLYDESIGSPRRFVELPMTIADMHLPRHEEEAAVRMVIDHLDTVRSLGGLGVLNWHVGHWHSDPAWRAAYCAACEYVAGDGEAWSATPHEISRWWLSTHVGCDS